MADTAATLLQDVKDYLIITWQDDKTDKNLTGYINRGMSRLQQIAGATLDFTKEGQPRTLLLDYCRYANSQALEVFEKNFEAELLDLNLSTQAPVIDGLTVMLSALPDGTVSAAVAPVPDDGDGYVYQVGTNLQMPERLAVCLPGSAWTIWDGAGSIAAASGQEVLIVEINDECRAERAGKATI
jgi:hypothetical protein